MTDLLQRFGSGFRCHEFPHAIYYAFEHALRFELGPEETPSSRPIKRFIHGFHRANAVSETIFKNSEQLWLLSATYGKEKPKKSRLKPYKKCGIQRASFSYLGATAQEDEDYIKASGSDLYRHWDAVELTDHDQLKEILWLALGREIGIRPTTEASIYIADFQNNIVLHPYDDRGMDVAALKRQTLQHAYDTHKEWLLAYDLPKMQSHFEN